jgi:two-component system chemotaxis response regulator CheY
MNSKLKVLVVDDSAVMRKIIISALTAMDIVPENISQAGDGSEAVAMVAEQTFDVVLMDWNMPSMLGIDAVRAIRASGNATPILMVTTEGERSNVLTAIQSGANNYLVKPFNSEDLRERVELLTRQTA